MKKKHFWQFKFWSCGFIPEFGNQPTTINPARKFSKGGGGELRREGGMILINYIFDIFLQRNIINKVRVGRRIIMA